MFALGGIIGVIVTLAWLEYLAHRERRAEARRECEVRGHQWQDPYPAMGSEFRNCRHCKTQQHRRSDGEWSA